MGHASKGLTCPYCKEYSSVRKDGKLYVHRGKTLAFSGSIRLKCRASGMTYEQACELRRMVDEGVSVWVAMKMIRDKKEDSEC